MSMREILGLDSLIGPNQVAKMFFLCGRLLMMLCREIISVNSQPFADRSFLGGVDGRTLKINTNDSYFEPSQ